MFSPQRLEVNCTISHKILSSAYALREGQSNGSAHPWLLPEKNHPLLLQMPSQVTCQELKDSIKSPALNQTENQRQRQKTKLSLREKNAAGRAAPACILSVPLNTPPGATCLVFTLGRDGYSTARTTDQTGFFVMRFKGIKSQCEIAPHWRLRSVVAWNVEESIYYWTI